MVLSGGQQAENTLHENAIGWMILLIVLALLAWMFWRHFDTEVRDIVRWIRYSEIWLISWFVGDNYTVLFGAQEVNFNYGMKGDENPGPNGYAGVAGTNKEKLNLYYMTLINALAMQPLKFVFVIIYALAAAWCMFLGPGNQFRTKMGLQGLIERQSKIFPVTAPFATFDPSKQPPRPPGSPVPVELPSFAEALGPEEWLAYNSIPAPDGKINETAAANAFRKQLGKRWKGANTVQPYKQVLLAAFCLKAARKRDKADEMLGRLAMCWSHKGGLNLGKDKSLLKEARGVLRDKKIIGKTLAKVNQHAFETTAIIRALAVAREEGGVLAPAQFVWLRGHDRRLWYPLNNLGRQSFHMEALGAMSHYKAEKLTQRPIPVPKMEGAVGTIGGYMASGQARPIPQLDYSASDKRGIKKAT
ncbi:MAG: phosphoesterase [Micavibrio sp.]|nr:MAG: phosphoesterase [Micavibrio sp.]